jgi:BlaI family transcriptional regulator, penicillinase repressor
MGAFDMKRRSVKLSPGEMEMLSMLWTHGELSLAEAHEAIGRPIGYTTIQTRLNRLVEKGFVTRSETRPCKYAAAVTQQAVSANHLDVLIDRVSGGHVVPLVAQLVGDRDLTKQEITDLKRIIHEAEKRTRDKS